MNDWLNRLCDVKRLDTFQAAKRWSERNDIKRAEASPAVQNVLAQFPGAEVVAVRAEHSPLVSRETQAQPLPVADTLYILKYGTKAYRKMKLESMVVPKEVPQEFCDPAEQAAFESVYKDRLHLLRIEGSSAL